MEKYILTVDIGTTSTKVHAFGCNGNVLGNFQKGYPTHYPRPDFGEQNPIEILGAVKESIRLVVARLNGCQLLGVSFSAAMHSLMLVDTCGEPLTPLIIWADNRSKAEAKLLKDQKTSVYKLGGTPIHPLAPICKIKWLQKNQPELVEQARKFISIKEFIFFQLVGEYAIDYSTASATGLFDVSNLKWNKEALDFAEIKSFRLSDPCPTERQFFLTEKSSEELGITRDIPLIIGASDGCLANLGCHAIAPGNMTITVGTSGAVRMATKRFATDELHRTFCYYLSKETYIVGGASNNGAMLLSWLTNQVFQHNESVEHFIDDAFSVKSAEGLIFLPYLLGERAPIYDADATGVYFGMTVNHKQSHFKRAMLEGICFQLKSIVAAVEEVVMPAQRIVVSGGFIQSQQWVQLLCDLLGRPIAIQESTDASSVGAAILGFNSLGIHHEFKSSESKKFYPNSEKSDYYEKVFAIFLSLYVALKDEFPKINQQ